MASFLDGMKSVLGESVEKTKKSIATARARSVERPLTEEKENLFRELGEYVYRCTSGPEGPPDQARVEGICKKIAVLEELIQQKILEQQKAAAPPASQSSSYQAAAPGQTVEYSHPEGPPAPVLPGTRCACGAAMSATARFCPECGSSAPDLPGCPQCGCDVSPASRFCPECGAVISRG